MNFGFYCNWGLVLHDGKYYISDLHFKYLKSAADISDKVFLLSTVRGSVPSARLRLIDLPNITVIPLPFFRNYANSFRFFPFIIFSIFKLVRSSDFVYLRTPEPFSWFAALLPKGKTILNYHHASNPMEVIFRDGRTSALKKYLKALVFCPEFYFISIAAYFNKASANGSSVLSYAPFFLRGKIKILYESTIEAGLLDNKILRPILNQDVVRFLSVGRLQPGKGIFELLEAFARLKKEQPNRGFCLTIVGDGVLQCSLKEYASSLGLNDSVDFIGAVSNGSALNLVYSKHDVFVMPSFSETGPRVLIEAMSESNFCISSNVGFVNEVLGDDAGKILNENTIDDLYQALVWVYENREVAKVMAGVGFLKSKNYSIESFFHNLLQDSDL